MRIKLAYGKTGLWLDLPEAWSARWSSRVSCRACPILPAPRPPRYVNPIGAAPLREVARAEPEHRVGIIFSDITRPTPHRPDPACGAARAGGHGVPRENITLFNALGTHRPNTEAELRGMIGGLLDDYRLVQNDAFDPRRRFVSA